MCLGLQISPVLGQESNIIDYSDNFILRAYTLTKFNSLTIEDTELNKRIILEPNGATNIGLGFNFKRFGLGLTVGLPKSAESDRIYGNTTSFDLQGSMYGTKIGGDGFVQYYSGYYNSNPADFIPWEKEEYPKIDNMRVLSVGVSAFYIFNSNRYSYRAAFVRDQMQLKGAGSFLLGVFGYYDDSRTDNGFVPQEYPDSVRNEIDLKEFNNLATGISVGYGFNFIIFKSFIAGIAVLPGFGYQRVATKTINNQQDIINQPVAQLLTKASISYDIRNFYFAVLGSVNFRNIGFQSLDYNLSTEQFRIIVGYRFGLK